MRMLKRFKQDQNGATAMLFGFAFLPLMGLAGAAVDYSRAASEHTKLQRAVDAAVLTLVREPRTATQSQLAAKAGVVLASVYAPSPGVTLDALTVDRVGDTVVLRRSARMTNAFMQVVGVQDSAVGATATAAWGRERLEIALVLDNTGSMNDLVGSKRKIDELKLSAGKLVDKLRLSAVDKDDVRLSVVPFTTEVRVDPAKYRNRDWLRWKNPADQVERNAWTGYIVDRHQPQDVRDTAPVMALADTLYTTRQVNYGGNDLASIQPLVSLHQASAYDAVKATIASMQPRGNTNVGLGVSWGLATLTGSVPLDTPASNDPRTLKRFMIVLTDGDNTQRWVNGEPCAPGGFACRISVNQMNDRTLQACTTAKAANVEVFTIRLLSGDAAMLGACASPPNPRIAQHYFNVQSESELGAAFQSILDAISGTRLTH